MQDSTKYTQRDSMYFSRHIAQVASIIAINMWPSFYLGGDSYETPDPLYEGSLGAHELISQMAEQITRELLNEPEETFNNVCWDDWVLANAKRKYIEKWPTYEYTVK